MQFPCKLDRSDPDWLSSKIGEPVNLHERVAAIELSSFPRKNARYFVEDLQIGHAGVGFGEHGEPRSRKLALSDISQLNCVEERRAVDENPSALHCVLRRSAYGRFQSHPT